MAEQLEGQDPIESTTTTTNTSPATTEAGGGDGGNGDGGTPKSNADILNQNRIKLYNDIVNLKDPVLSSNIKKIGFKKFSNLLQEDKEFQSALLTDLGERNFDITNEQFQSAYVGGRTGYTFDFGADARAARDAAKGTAEPTSEEDDSLLGQIKGLAKETYKYAKDTYNESAAFIKRGWYTGLAGRGAQAENFAMGNVDTENLAKYLKKANEIGTQKIEAEFAKDETFLKDADDLLAILVPSVMESFANMAGAGYQKLIGGTAAGAGVGAATGGLPGAVIGGGKGLQYAMLQQGYNLEFTGTVIDELQTKGLINLQADEATLKKQLDAAFADKKLMAPIYEKANTRALAITGTDFVLSGMGGRVLKNLGKSKAAGKLLNTPVGQMFSKFAEKTVSNPVYRKAARLTNRAAELDKKIAGSKLGKAGATIGVADMFGGGAGETLAQYLTQDELDWKSIAVEVGAEGKIINTLRKLGDIGQKKIQQKAISQFATEKNLPPNKKQAETVADDDWKPITEQEYDDFKKGKITPEKVAGLMDDVDIAMSNPGHLEKVAALDELYGKMVKDVYEMHLAAVETKDLYDLALNNIAELQNKKPEEIKAAITPGSPSFNEKIANDFKNNFNVLKQQYKEKNDSENASGLSSEVGKGQKPQQAQSEQGASEEETGDGGVLEAAAAEERIKEIDEFLSDNDQYFKDHGENILSQEELDDLIQEKETLLKSQGGGAAAPATTQQTGEQNVQVQQGAQSAGGVPPQSASTEVAGGVSETATPEGAVPEQPVVTSEEVVGETVPAPEIGIQGIIRGYKNIAGDKGIGDVRDLLFGENNGTQVIRGMDDNWYAISFSKKGGDGQGIYEQGGSTPRPGHIVTSVKINNPESKESIELAKQQSKEALDKILPTIKEGVIKEAAVLSALKSSASTQTKKTPTTTTTTETAPTKNVLKKPERGMHSSPFKFDEFKLGVNEKRGKALGHGVYLAKQQESTASNFSNVSLQDGVKEFQKAVHTEAEGKGYKYGFNNPAANILFEFGKKIISENGKVLMDVTGDIEQDIRAIAEAYNKKLGPKEKMSEAQKEKFATKEDIDNAVEFAKKHQDKLGAAYEYEIEYETDGYIVPDTTSKVNTLPKEILDKISSHSADAKRLVDAAAKNKNATFQDLYNGLTGVKSLGSPAAVSNFLDSVGIIGQNDNGQILIYNDKKVNVVSRKEVSYAEKTRQLKAAAEKATSATTSTSEKQKPVAKEIKNADVEVRKGKTHDKDGVYEAVYKGKVIGKFSFDKKEKVWVDASGDKFAQKKDAISKFVLRYNMANEAAAETSTAKGEGKGKAAPTTTATETKTEKKPEVKTETKGTAKSEAKTETKGETKPTGKKETKPQTPKTNPFAETVRKGMEALMGAIGSKVKMNFLSPEEAAKIAAMPEKKRGKLLFQTTAWHGTPHTFSKFKTEKINTGEQAQAFGWGLYFTDDKEIAEYYANELAGLKYNISLEELKNILPPSPNFESLANNLQRNVRVRGINEGVQKFKEEVELLGEDSYTPEELEFVKNLKQEDVQTKNVYKVTLFKGKKRYVTAPIKSSDGKWNVYDSVVWDKIQAMPSSERQGILDNFDKVKPQKRFNSKEEASNWIADNNEYTWLVWDKRVDKAQVKGLLLQLTKDQLKKFNNSFFDGLPIDATNQDLYRGLSRALGGAEQASLFLLENGIDGVKYPAKSVGTGITSDTARDFNYVVFDENAITIEERNGETIPIQVAVGYRGIRGEYRADYNGIQYFAVNERYAKAFGNNIIKASISTDKILDLDKYNKLLESKGLNLGGQSQGFFTIDDSIFDENGNFTDDRMLGRVGRAKSQIGVEEFNKIYDQFVKEFNNADVIYGEDIGNPGEKVYAVKNPDAINTNNVDAAAPEGVQYMKTPDGKILGFVQKLPDGSYNVYINPETQDAETPVHEIAGHIFLPLIKESNPELYNQGTALIQNSEYMGKANGDIAEALALAVGDKGKLLAEKPRKGFMEWLKGMWEWVGDKLRLNPDKIKNLTLGQFTDLIAGSVLKGKELAETKPTEKAETKEEKPAQTTKALPSFSEFDAISEDRSKMKEAKAEFIAKHGQLAYDAMKEISANFTKITKALQEKEILTKKC